MHLISAFLLILTTFITTSFTLPSIIPPPIDGFHIPVHTTLSCTAPSESLPPSSSSPSPASPAFPAASTFCKSNSGYRLLYSPFESAISNGQVPQPFRGLGETIIADELVVVKEGWRVSLTWVAPQTSPEPENGSGIGDFLWSPEFLQGYLVTELECRVWMGRLVRECGGGGFEGGEMFWRPVGESWKDLGEDGEESEEREGWGWRVGIERVEK